MLGGAWEESIAGKAQSPRGEVNEGVDPKVGGLRMPIESVNPIVE